MRIAVIGTGRIGSRMAMNLLKAGHEVYVHDVKKESAGLLLQNGAKWAEGPAKAAEATEVTIASLPGPVEAEEVALGANGVLAGAARGHIYIDTSTTYPGLVQRIAARAAEKGVDMLEAPLTRGVAGAETGTLCFMVGGDAEVLRKVQPVLEVLGDKILHLGPVGSGTVLKLINNMVCEIHVQAFAEAFALAAKFGLDLKQVYDLLSSTRVGNGVLTDMLANRAFKGNYEPSFTLDLAYKDQTLIAQLGRELGVPLYFNAMVLQRMQDARARGLGSKDCTAVLLPLEELLKVKIRVE
ncbi:MAG: NAD(P)-dependent oxidoreductase [Chloroflexi bacterium]|nr:NAD(P)-dependent oxidoreductase [Chloroflexota bacterium]